MENQGKIIAVLPPREGTSSRGTAWKVQEFVMETHEQYPKKMVFEVFGADRIERFGIQAGQEVNVAFDIDAREWNGRWHNSVRAYDVRQTDAAPMASAPSVPQAAVSAPVAQANPITQPQAPAAPQEAGDLPF